MFRITVHLRTTYANFDFFGHIVHYCKLNFVLWQDIDCQCFTLSCLALAPLLSHIFRGYTLAHTLARSPLVFASPWKFHFFFYVMSTWHITYLFIACSPLNDSSSSLLLLLPVHSLYSFPRLFCLLIFFFQSCIFQS